MMQGQFRKELALFLGLSSREEMALRPEAIVDALPSWNTAEGAQLLRQRVSRNDGEAAYFFAHLHVIGHVVPRNFAKARELFEVAIQWGYWEARAPLSALLAHGAGHLPRDWRQSLAYFHELAGRDPLTARQAQLLGSMDIDDSGNPREVPGPTFMSHDPLIVSFHDFMTAAECQMVVDLARDKLAPSTVVNPATGQLVNDPIRDSYSTAFSYLEENPFLHALNRRIAAASRSDPAQGEPTQVIAYAGGQQYRLHCDAIAGEANQRIQTFLVYLNDDFEGGATYFPHVDLSIRLPRGSAICFSNVNADMKPSMNARHAGLPVEAGKKFILSRWIRRFTIESAQ